MLQAVSYLHAKHLPADEARAYFEDVALPYAGHIFMPANKDWALIYSVTSTCTRPVFCEPCILECCSNARTSWLSFPLQIAAAGYAGGSPGIPGMLIKAASTFKGSWVSWVSGVADLLSKQNVLNGVSRWWSLAVIYSLHLVGSELIFSAVLQMLWTPIFPGFAWA